MSIVTEAPPATHTVPVLDDGFSARLSSRLMDYLSLTRPKISVMVLITVTVGYSLGQQGNWSTALLLHAWLGILLVAAGSSAINQWFEQETDARMRRTQGRPLPAGRLHSAEVFWLGLIAAATGSIYLALMVNLLTAALTASTFLMYGFIYTPLKRYTSLCTAIGAVPGALPPVLGWTAAGQPLDLTAFSLFGLLFFWQFPHFLAIAWLHREDYLAAGLRMLPGGRPQPHVTGLMATVYAIGLIPISLVPVWLGIASDVYGMTALISGVIYLLSSIGFAWQESRTSARRVLWVSLVYLPLILGVLAGDHWRLLQ